MLLFTTDKVNKFQYNPRIVVSTVVQGTRVRWFRIWYCQEHMMYMCCKKGNSTNIRGFLLFSNWMRTRSVCNSRSASKRSGLVLLRRALFCQNDCSAPNIRQKYSFSAVYWIFGKIQFRSFTTGYVWWRRFFEYCF